LSVGGYQFDLLPRASKIEAITNVSYRRSEGTSGFSIRLELGSSSIKLNVHPTKLAILSASNCDLNALYRLRQFGLQADSAEREASVCNGSLFVVSTNIRIFTFIYDMEYAKIGRKGAQKMVRMAKLV
jgi:hypothetical protein